MLVTCLFVTRQHRLTKPLKSTDYMTILYTTTNLLYYHYYYYDDDEEYNQDDNGDE